jgi:hypothetical protein
MRGTFPAFTAGGLASPIVGFGILVLALLYLDHRIAR